MRKLSRNGDDDDDDDDDLMARQSRTLLREQEKRNQLITEKRVDLDRLGGAVNAPR